MQKQEKDLQQLAQFIKESNELAFTELFDELQESLFNFLLFKSKDAAVSEDLLQETFLRLWKKRKNINPDKSIKAFLYTIAGNLALNHIRDNSLRVSRQNEIVDRTENVSTPHEIFENAQLNEQLSNAIQNLSEKNRITFLMSKYEGFTYKEIAERLDIPVKTVESRMSQALKELREDLKNSQG